MNARRVAAPPMAACLLCVALAGCGGDSGQPAPAQGPAAPAGPTLAADKEYSTVPGVSLKLTSRGENVAGTRSKLPDGTFEGIRTGLLDALLYARPWELRIVNTAKLPAEKMDITVAGGEGPVAAWKKLTEACEKAFALRIRRGQVDFHVYILRRKPDAPLTLRTAPPGARYSWLPGQPRARFTACSMGQLAELFENELEMPVLDQTGLTERYTFEIPYRSGDPAFTLKGLPDLGLEATREQRTLDVIQIDPAQAAP